MQRTWPHLIAALVFLSAAAWSLHLAVAPEPFAPSSAAAIAIGLAIFGLIALTGLLLARGRWARYLAMAVAAATAILAVALEPGPWYVIGLVLSGLTIIGLTGPWLDGWVRRFPSADGPGPRAVLLVFLTLSLVPAVGVASPAGLELSHGILGGLGVLLAWAYARAQVWSLWAMRLVLPVFAIGPVLVSPWGGRLLLIVLVGAVVALAWSGEAARAVQPLLDRLPGPRVASPPGDDLSPGSP
jgi:hypothetical protein